MSRMLLLLAVVALFTACSQETADEPHPAVAERHELMEGVRDNGAKVLGPMLKGEVEFDNAVAMEALGVWQSAAAEFGSLFPEGSQGGEAAPAIWEDRAGFEAALAEWAEATDAAIAANPGTLDDGQAVIGAAFSKCKNCHDNYRIEE